jgi:Uma2 family endonuclease
MISAKRPRATYADLEQLPEDIIGEIIDGELYTQPRPAVPHANATSNAYGLLFGPFRMGTGGGPGGWVLLFEPELQLGSGPDVLVPDIAGWRRERMPEPPSAPAITLAPDWVCEVLSPSTGRVDRVKKMPIFARERVGHVWLIDPALKTLEVFRRADGKDTSQWILVSTHSEDDKVRAEPFDAIELDLAFLWSK